MGKYKKVPAGCGWDQRVEPRLAPDGECRVWTGARNEHGYGALNIHGRGRLLVHRYTYEQMIAPIPPGMLVMHTCDNPPCCNPEHLRLGTQADNMADCAAKGRLRTQKLKAAKS